MKTILEINVEPFIVPAYVSEQMPAPLPVAPSPLSPEKYQPSHRTFALRELSVANLDRLIAEFAAGVYKVAGKTCAEKAPGVLADLKCQDELSPTVKGIEEDDIPF